MKPAPFEYHRASSLEEVISLLAELGPEVKLLAGGQSLIPMMKLRLARPRALIDLNRVGELAYLRREGGANGEVLAFGAMARLADLESAAVVAACPILATAARHIGHPAIRHRGTVCGSLAHADPAAELPVMALALDAEFRAIGPSGERRIAARDFFVTYFTTCLAPDEVLVETRFPVLPPRTGWSFLELSRRHGDYALASVAALLDVDEHGRIASARLALGAVADRAIRCSGAERLLSGETAGPALFAAAAAEAAHPLDPPSDVHASSAYRKEIAQVLIERALTAAWERLSRTNKS